jgi:hypothetical protein
MRSLKILAVLAAATLGACGGGGGGGKGAEEPGTSHVGDGDGQGGGEAVAGDGDAGAPAEALPDAGPPPPPRSPVTFIIKNDGKTDLTFALDKGWGSTVFAYSGKPPKAKSIHMFPKFCTGACELATPEEACPICKEADDPRERQKEEKAETVRQVVASGGSYELGWDAQVLVYGKAPKEKRGKNKKCECFTRTPPEPAEYTVRACGLRTANEVGKTSKMECVEGAMTLPVPEGQTIDVTLTFTGETPAPAKKPK